MEVGEELIWVNAVVTVVLMNREGKEERWTMPSWMGKTHWVRPTPCQELHGFTDFGIRLLIAPSG